MQSQNSSPDDEIDLRQLIAALWEAKWLIIATTLVGSAIAVAYALLATPIYRAEALVQIRQEAGGGGGLNALAAQFGGLMDLGGLARGSGDDRALTLATLKSRVVIQAFIRDNKLLPELFASQWDAENGHWAVRDAGKEPTLWHGYKFFSEKVLVVSEDKKSGLVNIAVEWHDPEAAAAWATELIARTNAHTREQAILESERNLDYLRQQVKQTGLMELQQAVYSLVESELKKLMLAKGGEEYAIKTVDPAQPPKLHVKPNRKTIAIFGFILGGFIGFLIPLGRLILRPQAVSATNNAS